MPIAVFGLLFGAWLAGVVTDHLFGGLTHGLLAVCTAALLARIVQGRAPLY